MTSITSPFSSRCGTKDRLHEKFNAAPVPNDMVFIKCEKDGKVVCVGISRKDYILREQQIANGLISDNLLDYAIATEI